MPIATLTFTLPDEEVEHRAALQGLAAKSALWEIDQRCRALMKYETVPEAVEDLAREIRSMIPAELLED